ARRAARRRARAPWCSRRAAPTSPTPPIPGYARIPRHAREVPTPPARARATPSGATVRNCHRHAKFGVSCATAVTARAKRFHLGARKCWIAQGQRRPHRATAMRNSPAFDGTLSAPKLDTGRWQPPNWKRLHARKTRHADREATHAQPLARDLYGRARTPSWHRYERPPAAPRLGSELRHDGALRLRA